MGGGPWGWIQSRRRIIPGRFRTAPLRSRLSNGCVAPQGLLFVPSAAWPRPPLKHVLPGGPQVVDVEAADRGYSRGSSRPRKRGDAADLQAVKCRNCSVELRSTGPIFESHAGCGATGIIARRRWLPGRSLRLRASVPVARLLRSCLRPEFHGASPSYSASVRARRW